MSLTSTSPQLKDVLDTYFNQPQILYRHALDSFDNFIDNTMPTILTSLQNNIFHEAHDENRIIRYMFKFSNIVVSPPRHANSDEMLYPYQALAQKLMYSSKVTVDVEQIQEIHDLSTNEITRRVNDEKVKNVPLMNLPIMVKSKYCNLSQCNTNAGECKFDGGSHFIILGNEKIVISCEKPCDNKVLVFDRKVGNKISYSAIITSKDIIDNNLSQKVTLKYKNNGLFVTIPHFKEMSVIPLLRLLGFVSDKDIIDYISLGNKDDVEMRDMIELIIKHSDVNRDTRTKDECYNYITKKLKTFNADTMTQESYLHMRMHADKILNINLLPHEHGGLKNKGMFLCFMINKLCMCIMGRSPTDDRDNFENKRIDTAGTLIEDLFKKCHRKILDKSKKYIKTRSSNHDSPINAIPSIRSDIIDQSFRTAFMTGNWGAMKTGIVQMMQRISYLHASSSKRRIVSLSGGSSQMKLVGPRHYHPSQCGFCCPVETPEGKKIGVVKHLSISASVTVGTSSQNAIIKNVVKKHTTPKLSVSLDRLSIDYKIFANGEWLGCSSVKDAYKLYLLLKENKLNGLIDPRSSIVFDVNKHEMNVWTDSGRLYRPVFRVSDNQLIFNKEHLIGNDVSGNSNWNSFLVRNPTVFEYITSMEHANTLIAENFDSLKQMHDRSKVKPTKNELVALNRYDENIYVKYTHAEIHGAMVLGMLTSSLPYSHLNPGTRNIFQYSQGRHALDIYSTNYRFRHDISSIMYYPQRPLVNSRFAEYMHTDKLSAGENAVVAIMCYTGYNQEDSIIFNQAAIDRGLFSVALLKKMVSTLQRSSMATHNEEFMKPNPSKVQNMRQSSNYSKLNEDGYVPVGTVVEDKDILIGKVTPIKNSHYQYQDNSEEYKGSMPAVVDSVIMERNADGYDTIKISLRTERMPSIGNKYVSRNAQKGTIGNIYHQTDMPYTEGGIVPSLILNPCAMPTRKTIGQLTESMTGKLGALEGTEIDGTPFNDIDYESVATRLEEQGFNRHGYETMYVGATGEKIKSLIYIGPTFYRVLKHIVSEKLHSRQNGSVQLLTRQPPEGRAKGGGNRVGQMEKDVMVAHGTSSFQKEKFVESSDMFTMYICNNCHLVASRRKVRDQHYTYNETDIYECTTCGNDEDLSKVVLPWSCHLFFTEMQGMGVVPKIKCDKFNCFSAVN